MNHPNKAHFVGVLTILDEPSDKSPAGAMGHRITLTAKAAENALTSLIGMCVCANDTWTGHNKKFKIGVIETAEITDKKIVVSGYLFKYDFPEVIASIQACSEPIGMSFEAYNAHVDDMTASVWTISQVTFVGAAILLCEKAAYHLSSFSLTDEKA